MKEADRTKFNSLLLPVSFWILGFIFIASPMAYFIVEKRIAQERGFFSEAKAELEAELKKGCDVNLVKAFESSISAIETNYEIVFDENARPESKAKAEKGALEIKLTMMTLLMDVDPNCANWEWKVLKLKEYSTFTNKLKDLQNTVIVTAQYESGLPLNKMPLNLYFELGVEPPEFIARNIRIKNLFTNEYYEPKDIHCSPLGTKEASSPLWQITVNVKKTDLRARKITKLQIEFPSPFKQTFPYSIFDLQLHRYKRGVGEVEVFLKFDIPVLINHYSFNEDRRFVQSEPGETFNLIESKQVSDDKYLLYHFSEQKPKNPIALSFLIFQ